MIQRNIILYFALDLRMPCGNFIFIQGFHVQTNHPEYVLFDGHILINMWKCTNVKVPTMIHS